MERQGKGMVSNTVKELISKFLDMWKDDYQFKTVASSALSALIGLCFTIFNAALGIIYKSVWNGTICVYYVLLAIVRGTIVNAHKKEDDRHPKKGYAKRKKIYFITHFVMILMNIALIAPIAYMIIGENHYKYGLVPAIAMAAYTTYRITMSIIHMKKAGKEDNILVKELRVVNFQDSLVSLLTLQNALIIATGDGMQSMITLTAWTSGGIWLAIVFFTVKSFAAIRKA